MLSIFLKIITPSLPGARFLYETTVCMYESTIYDTILVPFTILEYFKLCFKNLSD